MADKNEPSNVFEDPRVSEMWMNITELTGDATVAKDVITYMAVEIWNLPWATWEALHEAASD